MNAASLALLVALVGAAAATCSGPSCHQSIDWKTELENIAKPEHQKNERTAFLNTAKNVLWNNAKTELVNSGKTELVISGKTELENNEKTEHENNGKTELENNGKTELENNGKTELENNGKTELDHIWKRELWNNGKNELVNNGKTEPENKGKTSGREETAVTTNRGERDVVPHFAVDTVKALEALFGKSEGDNLVEGEEAERQSDVTVGGEGSPNAIGAPAEHKTSMPQQAHENRWRSKLPKGHGPIVISGVAREQTHGGKLPMGRKFRIVQWTHRHQDPGGFDDDDKDDDDDVEGSPNDGEGPRLKMLLPRMQTVFEVMRRMHDDAFANMKKSGKLEDEEKKMWDEVKKLEKKAEEDHPKVSLKVPSMLPSKVSVGCVAVVALLVVAAGFAVAAVVSWVGGCLARRARARAQAARARAAGATAASAAPKTANVWGVPGTGGGDAVFLYV